MTSDVTNALAAMKAAVEQRIAWLTAQNTRSAARHVLDNVLLTVAHLVGEVDAGWAWFLLVAVVGHFGMSTVWRWAYAGEIATYLRATRHRRLQYRAAAVANELLEAGLKAWRASAAMARHGAVMEPTGKRLGAWDGTFVQAGRVHGLQFGQSGSFLRLVLGLKVERAALTVALMLTTVS